MRFGNHNPASRLTFYKAFPWLGVYLFALNVNNRKQQSLLFLAFLLMLIIFYTMYIASIFIWNSLIFPFPYKLGIQTNLIIVFL